MKKYVKELRISKLNYANLRFNTSVYKIPVAIGAFGGIGGCLL